MRITKAFHRNWLIFCVIAFAVLIYIDASTYFDFLASHPTYDILYEQCHVKTKKVEPCRRQAVEEEMIAFRGDSQRCIDTMAQSNRLTHILNEAELMEYFRNCEITAGFSVAKRIGGDYKTTILLFMFGLVLLPYLLVPFINWVDGLVDSKDEEDLDAKIRDAMRSPDDSK